MPVLSVSVPQKSDKIEMTKKWCWYVIYISEPKAIAIMTLGYITDESQNDVLTADTSIFEFIISILKNAIKDPLHRYKGFSTEEMATGLGVLARNDDNKVRKKNQKLSLNCTRESFYLISFLNRKNLWLVISNRCWGCLRELLVSFYFDIMLPCQI